MQKKVLSEIDLYYGKVDMPKGFDIDRHKIKNDIITSFINNKRISNNPKNYSYDDFNISFSQPLQWLKDYIRDHIRSEYGFTLVNKLTTGEAYKPNEISIPLLNIDPVDLRNSPDYTMLYGVNIKECSVRIHYDDNRRKGRSWDIPLKNNQFIIFPSTNMYYITNNQKDSLNFILTSTYEYI